MRDRVFWPGGLPAIIVALYERKAVVLVQREEVYTTERYRKGGLTLRRDAQPIDELPPAVISIRVPRGSSKFVVSVRTSDDLLWGAWVGAPGFLWLAVGRAICAGAGAANCLAVTEEAIHRATPRDLDFLEQFSKTSPAWRDLVERTERLLSTRVGTTRQS